MDLPRDAELSITEQECRRRTEMVQRFAAEHNLAAVVAFSAPRASMWSQTGHVGYIANWSNLDRHNDCAVFVPVQGDPVLLYTGAAVLAPLIKKVSWLPDIRIVVSPTSIHFSGADTGGSVAAPGDGDEPPDTYGGTVRQLLSEHGTTGQPVGLVDPANIPYGAYMSFKRALGDLLREDIPDIFATLRAVKSPAEVSLHRKAASLADLGFEILSREARAGRWGHQVVAQVEAAIRAEGADYTHLWMCSCPADRWDGLLDLRPHDRLLQDGDQMAACVYVTYAGYWVQAMRCGSIGRPCHALEEACHVVSDMVETAAAVARPGLPVAGVVEASAKVAEQAGYRMPDPRVGHGHGLDYSERPFLVAASSDTFRAGNLIVMHPMVHDRDTGAVRIPMGDPFIITEDGAEPLLKFPRSPFIVE